MSRASYMTTYLLTGRKIAKISSSAMIKGIFIDFGIVCTYVNLSLMSELRRKRHALLLFDETVRSENAIVLFRAIENQVVAS